MVQDLMFVQLLMEQLLQLPIQILVLNLMGELVKVLHLHQLQTQAQPLFKTQLLPQMHRLLL